MNTNIEFTLTTEQLFTLTEALRIAAERYREHNEFLRGQSKLIGGNANLTALADTFHNQEQRAEALSLELQFIEHRQLDPHCTCNDCIAHHAEQNPPRPADAFDPLYRVVLITQRGEKTMYEGESSAVAQARFTYLGDDLKGLESVVMYQREGNDYVVIDRRSAQ